MASRKKKTKKHGRRVGSSTKTKEPVDTGRTSGHDERAEDATPDARAAGGTEIIQSEFGDRALRSVLEGKSFIFAIVELVKNCRDYRASSIWLTFIEPNLFRIVDDGKGMGCENRKAFVSLDLTTAVSASQAGRFGMGTTQTLVSHGTKVTVRTAPEEEPDRVYEFEFTAEEKLERVRNRGTTRAHWYPKTPETWPYAHEFGTEITYVLKAPKSKTLRPLLANGCAKLAEEISSRLPVKFRDIVFVNGERIPEKAVIGEVFVHNEMHPQLGNVSLELYRPAKKHKMEALRLTGVEIGEVPFGNFVSILNDELHDRVPLVLRYPDVCGDLVCSFLRDYPNADRDTIRPDVADDVRTVHFVELLRTLAPHVEEKLKIKIAKTGEPTAESRGRVVDEFLSLVSTAYPSKLHGPSSRKDDGPEEPDGHGEQRPLRLTCRHEYELGQEVCIRLHMSDELRKQFSPDDVQWHTDRSLARNPTRTRDGLRLVADALGQGRVRADIPGTPHSVTAKYVVVRKRAFRIDTTEATIRVGSTIYIMGVNTDRLKGDRIMWSWNPDNVGKCSPEGARLKYQATVPGTLEVYAKDPGDPNVSFTCTITILPVERSLYRIRDHHFTVNRDRIDQTEKPVVMVPGGDGSPNEMFINVNGSGFQLAEERGETTPFLAYVTGSEYARFVLLVLRDVEADGEIETREVPSLMDEFQTMSLRVYEELLKADKRP